MKNFVQSIRIRTIVAARAAAIAAVMAVAVPALTSTSVATAQAWDIPRLEVWIGPFKICPIYCFVPGYCCKPEGVL